MSIEAIVARIVEESEAEAAAILADADVRAAAIVDGARSEHAGRVAAALERAEPALRAERTRRMNAARKRRLDRDARRTASRTTDVFERAGARLEAMATGADPGRWAAALRALVGDAIEQVGDRPVVRIRATDAAAIEDLVAVAGGRLDFSDEADLPPGVIVRSADGRLEIDATLPTRLDRARTRLADSTARLLGVAG